ncbi:MAG TPA: ABC transporter permease [Spirochaetia bacterium]
MEPLKNPAQGRSFLARIGRWESILALIFVAVFVFNSFASPYFLNPTNLLDTTFTFVEKGLIALPMTLGIILGDIDISVEGIIALCSLVMGALSQAGASTEVLVIAGLVVGLAAGLLNGLLATRFAIPMIAVTIGGVSLFRGIAYAALGDQAYTKYPASFAFFGQGYILGTHIPFELIVFVVFAVLFGILLHRTTFGRNVYAIGNNPTAARFSGVRVERMRVVVSCLTGLMSGVAAILLTSRIGSTRPNIANGWAMEIITTVVLGGVAITGGRGNIGGVILGIFLLGFLKFGMSLINVMGTVQNIFSGVLLIVAILLPGWVAQRQEKARLRITRGGEGR